MAGLYPHSLPPTDPPTSTFLPVGKPTAGLSPVNVAMGGLHGLLLQLLEVGNRLDLPGGQFLVEDSLQHLQLVATTLYPQRQLCY